MQSGLAKDSRMFIEREKGMEMSQFPFQIEKWISFFFSLLRFGLKIIKQTVEIENDKSLAFIHE